MIIPISGHVILTISMKILQFDPAGKEIEENVNPTKLSSSKKFMVMKNFCL